MKKKKITVADLRKCLSYTDCRFGNLAEEMSNEELLKAKPHYDFGMDSMDITELTMEIEKECAVSFPDDVVDRYIDHHWRDDFASLLRVYNEEIA